MTTEGMKNRDEEKPIVEPIVEPIEEPEREIKEDAYLEQDMDQLINIEFPNDEDLARYVVFVAGLLFIICSIPCLCIVCCCCGRKRIKLCGGEPPNEEERPRRP